VLADLAPLREPAFRRYWTGQAVSSFGDGMVLVVAAFAVLSVGGSATMLGTVLAAGSLCRVLSALAGGVAADRYPRRVVLISADSSRCVIQCVIGSLLLSGMRGPWFLLVGSSLYGIAAGFFGPATSGILPSLVHKDLLQKANALQSLTRSIVMVLGPAVAGLLIASAGVGTVYIADGATFATNVAFLLAVRCSPPPGHGRRKILSDVVQGWHELMRRRWLPLTMLAHSAWNLGFAAFFVLGPGIIAHHLGGPIAWGIVSAGLSVGLMIGSAIALRWQPHRPLVVGNLALILGAAPLLALSVRAPVAVIAGAAAVSNAGLVLLNAVWSATLQRIIPNYVLARVTSYDWLLSFISLPLGYALAGPSAHLIGDSPALVAAAAFVAIPSALTMMLPTVRRLSAASISRAETRGSRGPTEDAPTARYPTPERKAS